MLLRVNAVNKLYGVETILENVSLQIGAREKVALVGRNGAGKTTLLRIITGEIQPDGGSLTLAPGATIGYLSQNADLPDHLTVRQAAEQAAGARLEIQRRLEELSVLIEEHSTPSCSMNSTICRARECDGSLPRRTERRQHPRSPRV